MKSWNPSGKKSITSVVVCVSLIILFATMSLSDASSKPDVSKAMLNFVTLSPGTTYYTISIGLAEVVQKHSPIKMVTPQPAPGTRAFPKMLEAGHADIGLSMATDMYQVYKGTGVFEGEPYDIRAVQSGHEMAFGIFTHKKTGIGTIEQLRGKRFAWEITGAVTPTILAKAIMEFHKMDPYKDVIHVRSEHVRPAWLDLVEGRADAVSINYLTPSIKEHAHRVDAVLIPIDPDTAAYVSEKIPGLVLSETLHAAGAIPAGVPTMAQASGTFCLSRLDEEIVYHFVKAVIENYDEIKSLSPELAQWSPDRAVRKLPIPYHNGAIRAYKEAGLWGPEMDAHQASFFK